MIYMVSGLSVAFALSIALNVYLYYRLRYIRANRPQSVELKEFLTDMNYRGMAMLQVRRMDVSDYFTRSPRDIR